MTKQENVKTKVNKQVSVSRLLGVYPQKQDGFFMQRIKIPGGRITWLQWRKIADIASTFTSDFPLHITTRQDIELHNIILEDIPIIHQYLSEAFLITFGACGDSVRNITICPGCDLHKGAFDLIPMAQLVQRHLEQHPVVFNLPRKFKISFSGCRQACAKPWLSDLGFIAQKNGLFTVIGAGSLGPKPLLGIKLYKDLPSKNILPLCVAALNFFERYGNRGDRRRARFRHIREKLSDQTFLAELDAQFCQLKAQQAWPDIVSAAANKNIKLLYKLQLPNGNISPQEALELADIAESEGTILRVNLEHGLELFGKETFQLPKNLTELTKNPIIIACPGSTTCPRGLVDCWATADQIRKNFTNQQTRQLRICISGCPNSCAHSSVADIGFVGMVRKENGEFREHYRLFTGGGNGTNEKLAERLSVISTSEVNNFIGSLVEGLS